MELTTIFGIIAGVAAVVGAMIYKGIDFGVLVNIPAFFIIGGGTVATIMNSFPGSSLKNIGSLFKILFTTGKSGDKAAEEIITTMVGFATEARREGLLTLEAKTEQVADPFIRKGLRMLVDGLTAEYILDVMSAEIEAMEERHAGNANIFAQAGMYAPTLGVLGAVFGLIAAMSHIEDINAMAEAIAAAFIATIMGIFTGYVLWNPFANKLKVKSKQEVLQKRMVIEGIISIQQGESPVLVKEKLLALLPPSKQAALTKQQASS